MLVIQSCQGQGAFPYIVVRDVKLLNHLERRPVYSWRGCVYLVANGEGIRIAGLFATLR